MPNIFDEHNLKQAIKRIAAAKDDSQIGLADARAMRAHLDKVIATAEKREGAEARRIAKMRAAAENPDMAEMISWAVGRLRSIGILLHAAADLAALNRALRASDWKDEQKFEIKSVLAKLGVID
jgi:hypothetical protein